MKATDPRELFERQYIPEPNSGCWLWLGELSPGGYPRFSIRRLYKVGGNRFSLQMSTGEEGIGLEACHRCDNPSCVNPDHLFWGTRRQNMIDALSKGRLPGSPHNTIKTHCPHGHPYNEQNTRIYKGRRNCRTCQRLAAELYKTTEAYRLSQHRRNANKRARRTVSK